MRSTAAEGKRTVLIAFLANVGTALAKLVAAWVTGSSAMWAEAFHAFADSGNEILLLIAQQRSGRPPDERHPLGHGRAAYFWALVASLGVFLLGAVLSVRQGLDQLFHSEPIASFPVAYVTLAISFCLDGVSLAQAHRQLKREARVLTRSFLEHLDVTSDPIARAVFAEDAVALVGNLVALAGIALHQVTGSTIPDAIAAIIIGILLGRVAFRLAARNGDTLIGGQAPAALRGKISELLSAQPGIKAIRELLVTFIGPRQVWVVARVAIDPSLNGADVERVLRAAEDTLRRATPFITRVDLVPRGH